MSQFGNETRTSILPIMSPLSSPAANYDPSNELPPPGDVPGGLGIKRDGSLDMVVKSFRGMGYYVDMVGFGSQSSDLSLPGAFPMGNNYFMNTSAICDNGATMWYYVNGIPTGDALGQNVKKALSGMGLPELKGLAPGIIEDAKDALDPTPLLGAMFGKGYPVCHQLTAPVGDSRGKLQNADGEYWIEDKDSVFSVNDKPHQRKWVQVIDSKGNPIFKNKKEFDCTPKAYDANGNPLPADKIPPLAASCSEGFLTIKQQQTFSILTVGLLVTIAVLWTGMKKQ